MDQRFRWDEKLHRKSDFKRIFEEGRRYGVPGLTMRVYIHPHELPRPKARLGLAISKAYGIAVARNRIKRILREVFRLNKSKLDAGTDIVFSARPLSTKPNYKTLEPLVLKLWAQAKLLQPSPKP